MKSLTPRGEAAPFFRRLVRARNPLLLLDYDGTLAPFRNDRHLAVPAPGVRERLSTLMTRTRTHVVIVTGRMVDDLPPLLAVNPRPDLFGAHGWERLYSDGWRHSIQPPEAERDRLARAWKWIEAGGHAARCERKAASVTIHWRGEDPTHASVLEDGARNAWQHLADGVALELHPFEGGLELRCITRHKGTATIDLLGEHQPDAVAFLGDDRTDEDAFAALVRRSSALSVLVRNELRVPTCADLWITPGDELLEFLDQWIQATLTEDGGPR